MKTISVNHLYDCYPLYTHIYGGTPHDKFAHAWLAHAIYTERYLPEKNKGVLELLSGHGEHERMFKVNELVANVPYYSLDRLGGKDATNFEVTDKVDMVAAFWYSLPTVLDLETMKLASRNQMQTMFTSAYNALNPKGSFLVHLGGNPLDILSTFSEDHDDDGFVESYIPRYDPIRELAEISHRDDAVLQYTESSSMDRYDNVITTKITNIQIKSCGSIAACFFLEKPFELRYYSEQEVCNFARNAGFKRAEFIVKGMTEGFEFREFYKDKKYSDSVLEEDCDFILFTK